tara:strand:- start:818 stop:931 length:114 start_codon:yes stop_codon:yes gene_type:complete
LGAGGFIFSPVWGALIFLFGKKAKAEKVIALTKKCLS